MNVAKFLPLGALLAGCASLSVRGEHVQLTHDPHEVAKCTPLGRVSADPPFDSPEEWQDKLRNEAGERGADRVLAGAPGVGSVPGEAYSCAKSTKAAKASLPDAPVER